MTDVVHVITPGDHFSPRTGSAIPTVVHGLSASAAADPRERRFEPHVLIDESTLHPRYGSATVLEYRGAGLPGRRERILDLVLGRLGRQRTGAAKAFRPLADELMRRPRGIVIAHNAPVLPSLLEHSAHQIVLYAHNDLLRTYSRSEADRALGGVSAIVCVSEALAARTRRSLSPALAGRVGVVENGVDCAQFFPAAGRDEDGGDRPLRVLFIGRMVPEKGADVLLRAAALTRRDDLEFVLVGSQGFDRGAELSRYERTLRELAQASRAPVRFEPFVDRESLPSLLRAADVLVVPSRWAEPSGLTAGEGLATGLPVIVSRVGGLPEVVGTAGMYVTPDDPQALADRIAELADDPLQRRDLSDRARARALDRDWAWAWSNLRRVLEEV